MKTILFVLVLAACAPAPSPPSVPTAKSHHAHLAQRLPKVGDAVTVRGQRARVMFVAHNGVDEHVAEVQFANGKRDTVRVCEIK